MSNNIEFQILYSKAFSRRGWHYFPFNITSKPSGYKKSRLAVVLSPSGPSSPEEVVTLFSGEKEQSFMYEIHEIYNTKIAVFLEIDYYPHRDKIKVVDTTVLDYLKLNHFKAKIIENADGRVFLGVVLKNHQSIFILGAQLTAVGLNMPPPSVGEQDGMVVVYWPDLPISPTLLTQLSADTPASADEPIP